MAEVPHLLGENGEVYCAEPDCDRGPGGKPFPSKIHLAGHYRKHAAEHKRAEATEERIAAAEAAEPVTPIRRRRPAARKGPPLEDRMAASLGFIGGGMAIMPMFPAAVRADGRSLVNHAKPLSDAAVDLAAENETVRKVCELLAGGGAWGGLLMALWAFGLEVAANHGWVKDVAAPSAEMSPEAMMAAMGVTPEMMQQAAAMFSQQFRPPAPAGPPPLRPDGADPTLTGEAEVRVA